jgi:protein-S-isoprenylcysteine O-methyltransferase Ste14
MRATGVSPAQQGRRDVAGGIAARAVQIGVMFLLIAALLFGAAGTLDWAWGWIYLAIYFVSVAINAWFLRRSPELVAERGRPAEAMPVWDKWLGGLWALAQFVALPLIAGLDVRFDWTGPVDAGWHVLGALLFAAGLALFGWAMIANAYFSTAARIQRDRGQTVCREGPYRFVRHPGYAGSMLQSVGGPLLLGSAWALLPAVAAVAAMAARTWFEDRMLRAELPGYAEYSAEVRKRLVPLVW